ncbi:T9SS type A sorting domain-containing protein [bacterium]|nr:T9SS type A sorting domain-containing protein [bacterium]
MKSSIRYSATLLGLFCLLAVHAQLPMPCVDSNRITPTFQCGANEFRPVCACNQTTYLNECESYNRNGINTILYNGVCQNDLFFFECWPVPAYDHIDFHLQVASDQSGPATIQIYDSYGHLVFFRNITSVPDDFAYIETIYLSGMKTGMYVVYVNMGRVFKYQKIMKYTAG